MGRDFHQGSLEVYVGFRSNWRRWSSKVLAGGWKTKDQICLSVYVNASNNEFWKFMKLRPLFAHIQTSWPAPALRLAIALTQPNDYLVSWRCRSMTPRSCTSSGLPNLKRSQCRTALEYCIPLLKEAWRHPKDLWDVLSASYLADQSNTPHVIIEFLTKYETAIYIQTCCINHYLEPGTRVWTIP